MTDKPSREDVLRIAVETGFINRPAVEGRWLASFERFAAAMYAAGAEDMRELADDAWADAIQSDCEHGVKLLSEKAALKLRNEYPALAKLGKTIRAIPITTNTEGE